MKDKKIAKTIAALIAMKKIGNSKRKPGHRLIRRHVRKKLTRKIIGNIKQAKATA